MRPNEQRLREELAAHLEGLAAEYQRQGMLPEAARRAARLKLGGEDQIRVQWQEARRWNWLERQCERWSRDFRLALRSLRRSPGYTAAVVITLGLAIAANAAIFSVTDAFLLRPLPYAQSSRLMLIRGVPSPGYTAPMSFAVFQAFQAQNHSFTGMTVVNQTDGVLTGHGEAANLTGGIVSPDAFTLLGARPAAGRFFLPAEAQPHTDVGTDAIVISHKLFASRFAGQRSAIGSAITLSGKPYTIVGVAPPGFVFPLGTTNDFWISTAAYAEPSPGFPRGIGAERSTMFLQAVGRLRHGMTPAMAARDLDRIAAAYRGTRGQSDMYPNASVEPLQQARMAYISALLRLLWAGAGLVLLIACANLAALALARGLALLPALRVRVALGARPRDLLRSLFSETLLLALAGCGIGLALAAPAIAALNASLGVAGVPVQLDARLVAYTAAIAAAAALIIGCWPAWAAARGATSNVATRATQRGRGVLVAAEVALALVLVAAAGLLARTMYSLAHTDPGFNPGHVLVADLPLPDAMHSAQRPAVYEALLERVRALPGVTAAAAGLQVPWSENWNRMAVKAAAGRRIPPFGFDVSPVTPGYFRTLGMHLLRGRAFTRADDAHAPPVVIVNQRFLQKLRSEQPAFPADPIGASVRFNAANEPARAIVGVVADITTPGQKPDAALYWPYAQLHNGSMSLLVRTAGDPMALLPALRRQLADVNPDLALGGVQLLADNRDNWAAQPEMAATVAGAFGLLALLLAATGLYGLIAYAVRQRERELGIRVALGAQRRDIYRLILGLAARLTLIGLICGGVGVYLTRGLLASQLYGLSPLDPPTLAAAVIVLAAAGLLAAYWPARRAARADPLRALRTE